jgi:hypothetical protein
VPADAELARWLQRELPAHGPPKVVLVANKAETREARKSGSFCWRLRDSDRAPEFRVLAARAARARLQLRGHVPWPRVLLAAAALPRSNRAARPPVLPRADLAEWTSEAAALGLGEPVALSATAGEGMVDLYTELRPVIDAAAEAAAARGGGGGDAAIAAAAAARARARGGGAAARPAAAAAAADKEAADAVDRGGGWAARHHLSSAELQELSLLRAAAGGGGGGEEDGEGDGGGDLSEGEGPLPDLGDISVADDGSIAAAGGGGGGGGGEEEEGGGGEPLPAGPLRVALMGAPNAGKSTMLNALLGWERALTGEAAGGGARRPGRACRDARQRVCSPVALSPMRPGLVAARRQPPCLNPPHAPLPPPLPPRARARPDARRQQRVGGVARPRGAAGGHGGVDQEGGLAGGARRRRRRGCGDDAGAGAGAAGALARGPASLGRRRWSPALLLRPPAPH